MSHVQVDAQLNTTPDRLKQLRGTPAKRNCRKMSSRTSARFAAAKRQRSSVPLEQQDNPQTHSPPRRRTRSQSVELGSNQSPVSARRGGRSVNQQQSVESDTSNASNASGRAGRRKGITTPALQPGKLNKDQSQF